MATTVAFALTRGLSLEEIEAASGVAGADLMDPQARLPDDVLVHIWQLLTQRNPGVALPLEMARAAPLSFFSGLEHGSQFADTLRSALALMIRHRGVMADRIDLAVEESGVEAFLTASHPLDRRNGGRVAELGMALVTRLMAETLGITDSLLRVEFAHPRVGPLADYRRFFRVEVRFEQCRSALVLRRDRLDAPVRGANEALFAYVEEHFAHLRKRINRDGYPAELAALLKAIEENAARGEFGAQQAAAGAGLGMRAAQRLAALHGTSLKTMIGDVRARSAQLLLADPTISIETVASLVGYSDERAFRRAFKRLSGQSPARFRRHSVSGGPAT